MRFDVGSGDIPKGEGWTTVDLYDGTAEVRAPAWELPVDSSTVEAVWCSHTLEHLTPQQVDLTLAEFHRVLIPGCAATLEVPDLEWACRMILTGFGDDWTEAYRGLYGEPDRVGRGHQGGFDIDRLFAVIVKAGFEDPKIEMLHSHGMGCLKTEAVKG